MHTRESFPQFTRICMVFGQPVDHLIQGHDAGRAVEGLFRLLPDAPLNAQITVTSDRREGFYRWWVFVADGVDAATALSAAEAHAA